MQCPSPLLLNTTIARSTFVSPASASLGGCPAKWCLGVKRGISDKLYRSLYIACISGGRGGGDWHNPSPQTSRVLPKFVLIHNMWKQQGKDRYRKAHPREHLGAPYYDTQDQQSRGRKQSQISEAHGHAPVIPDLVVMPPRSF